MLRGPGDVVSRLKRSKWGHSNPIWAARVIAACTHLLVEKCSRFFGMEKLTL